MNFFIGRKKPESTKKHKTNRDAEATLPLLFIQIILLPIQYAIFASNQSFSSETAATNNQRPDIPKTNQVR
jgi:hypothetical protein